jgi:hypothetical protein
VKASLALEVVMPEGKVAADLVADKSFRSNLELAIAKALGGETKADDVKVTELLEEVQRRLNTDFMKPRQLQQTKSALRAVFEVRVADKEAAQVLKTRMETAKEEFGKTLASELQASTGLEVLNVKTEDPQVVVTYEVQKTATSESDAGSGNTGAVIGAAVGGSIGALLCLGAVYWYLRKTKKGENKAPNQE